MDEPYGRTKPLRHWKFGREFSRRGKRMRREHQLRTGGTFAPFLFVIGAGMLLPACTSSGLGRKGSTTPDGSSLSDVGTGGIGGTETGGATPAGTTGTADGAVSPGGATGSGGATGNGGAQGTGGSISPNPDASPDLGTDAPIATGGIASTGGVPGSGGVTSTGGTISHGGVTSTGGIASPGGVIASGGVASSGGIASSAVASSGGVTSPGGITTSGGGTSSGGVTGSGGSTTTGGAPTGHFQMENLDRGVVAVVVTGGIYVGWHMFGYEYDTTAGNVSYNLYRDGTKIATVTDSTNYLDAAGTAISKYAVTAVVRGTEGPQSPAATPWAQNYLSIPLQLPAPGPQGYPYIASDGSPGDLDGDGQYDIVLKWDPSAGETESSVALTSYVLVRRRHHQRPQCRNQLRHLLAIR